MTKVVIEDVMSKVRDRFELVVLAATRTYELSRGSISKFTRTEKNKRDKDVVIALREIYEDSIDINQLRENLINSYNNKKSLSNIYFSRANNVYKSDLNKTK